MGGTDKPELAIPVKASASGKATFLKVTMSEEGEVVLIPPPGPGFILPPTSDQSLLEAIDRTRAIAASRKRGHR